MLVSACSQPTTVPNATTAPLGISSPNAPAATQPPANKSVLPSDPRTVVENALRAQPKALPFKITTTIGSGDTQINTITVIESPTRIMLVEPNRSVIWADGQCFEKTGDAAWQTCTNPTTGQTAQASVSSLLDDTTINDAISLIKTVKLTGTDTLNGINTSIYEYTSSGPLMGIQVDSTSSMWVDENKGLPVKVVTTSTVNGNTSTFTQLISYDPTIKVVTP